MTVPLPPVEEEPRTGFARLRRALARRLPWLQRAYRAGLAGVAWLRWRIGKTRLEAPAAPTAGWLWGLLRETLRRRREPRLTVGVDVTALWEPLTGIGWYLYRLLEFLAARDDVRIRLYGPTVVGSPDLEPPVVPLPAGPAIERVLWKVPPTVPGAGRLIGWLRRRERLLIAADRNDVLFAPNYFLPDRFSAARAPHVATVHDLGFRAVPWALQRETLAELRARFDRTIFEASRIITVSAAVRDELARFGYAGLDRVRVVHHGAGQLDGVEPEPVAGLPPRFALHVGTLEPRKNVLTLLDAWERLAEADAEPPLLVLCGRYGWKSATLRKRVRAGEAAGLVRHLGYVPAGQLAGLYRGAALVVLPSHYEGFGLPAIEALWAGTPLVCSDIPALREVAGEAALYAPPEDAGRLAGAVAEVLADPELAADLAARGRRRASGFSWTDAARRTLEVWREAAGGR